MDMICFRLGLKLRDCFSKFLIDIEPCIEGEKAWLNEIRRLAEVIPSFLYDNKSHNIDRKLELSVYISSYQFKTVTTQNIRFRDDRI